MSEQKIAVRLLHRYGINNPGEVCGFPPAEAAQLVEIGAAERLTKPDAAPVTKPAEAPVTKTAKK